MRKFLSDRNIAVALFVFTFFLFVLAQQYTRQNSQVPANQSLSRKSSIQAGKADVNQAVPAVIIAR